jgi:hypothetical protein
MDNILHIIHNTSTTLVATVTNITFATDAAIQHHADFTSLGLSSDFTATTTATSYIISTNNTVSFNLGYTAKAGAVNNTTYASTLTIVVVQDMVPVSLKVVNYIPIGASAPAPPTNSNYVGAGTGGGSPGGSGVSVPGFDLPVFILLGLDVVNYTDYNNTVATVDLAPKNVSVSVTDTDGSVVSYQNLVITDAATVNIPGVYDGIGEGGYNYSDTVGYTGGGGYFGGGEFSVSSLAYMPGTSKLAGQMEPGDPLLLLSEDRQGTMPGVVVSNVVNQRPVLTLVSESGIRLTCSKNTPLTLEDGSCVNSTEALGKKLPVEDQNGFRWELIVEVLDAGIGDVATIYCKDQCYAAGDQPGRWIWTHNTSFEKGGFAGGGGFGDYVLMVIE